MSQIGERQPRAYFERETESRFRPTVHVGGAWNTSEQHIAPSIGLLTHLIELDHAERHGDQPLRLSRVSCDILGVLPIEPVDVSVRVLRPGRTVELVEARLDHAGRTAATARAWFARSYDTTRWAGTTLPSIPGPEGLAAWDPASIWPGGFVASLEIRRQLSSPGRGVFWLRTGPELIAGEPVSATARMLGLADAANGMLPRVRLDQVVFPNLDLTAHLFAEPEGEWTGFDTSVSFGTNGTGLTQTVLHDRNGPFGTVAQTLTVRPR